MILVLLWFLWIVWWVLWRLVMDKFMYEVWDEKDVIIKVNGIIWLVLLFWCLFYCVEWYYGFI